MSGKAARDAVRDGPRTRERFAAMAGRAHDHRAAGHAPGAGADVDTAQPGAGDNGIVDFADPRMRSMAPDAGQTATGAKLARVAFDSGAFATWKRKSGTAL